MSKIGLMDLVQFKAATKVSYSLRSNPLIKDLDHLVELYHKPTLTTQQELKVLSHIIIWCLEYLKSDGTRKTGVDMLLKQALILIDSPLYEYALDDRNRGVRQGNPLEGTPPRVVQGKALEPAYKAETVLPGKGRVAGLKLESKVQRYNVPAYRDDALAVLLGLEGDDDTKSRYLDLIGMDDKQVAKNTVKAAEHLISKLPLSDQLQMLSKAMSFDAQANVASRRSNFEYCSSSEREQYRLYIAEGRFFHDMKLRRPVDTGARQAIYAIDEFGSMYMKFEDQMAMGSFNHSSFMSGKPVMCAGCVSLSNGSLTMIDNNSGHYRPTAQDLRRAIMFLHYERGVSMLGVTVRRGDLPKDNKGQYPRTTAWAVVFG